ncbi:MAG: hypothetical protein RLZZ324_1296 [Candidatus Parcubacteria bacterium]|jgi:hypothetical protein
MPYDSPIDRHGKQENDMTDATALSHDQELTRIACYLSRALLRRGVRGIRLHGALHETIRARSQDRFISTVAVLNDFLDHPEGQGAYAISTIQKMARPFTWQIWEAMDLGMRAGLIQAQQDAAPARTSAHYHAAPTADTVWDGWD